MNILSKHIKATLSLVFIFALALSLSVSACNKATGNTSSVESPDVVNIVFVSDHHYGLFRQFDGQIRSSEYVNSVMLNAINQLPSLTLPQDQGAGANSKISGIEMIISGGDITNRQHVEIQSAAESWKQFQNSFINKISTSTKNNTPTELFLIPGNHDVSNAIGHTKPLYPEKDATAMVEIYNMMMNPAIPKTTETYNYDTDKINYTVTRFGIKFAFLNIWLGENERQWLKMQLTDSIPVIIFAHDEPDIESKHLTNPVPPHEINSKYENIISDIPSLPGSSLNEQRQFAEFIKNNPSIKAYFHGNSNFNQFYTYQAPDKNISLPTFRVDSPIKGNISENNQSQLSFHLISIDKKTLQMTVRECFWGRGNIIDWGKSHSINL